MCGKKFFSLTFERLEVGVFYNNLSQLSWSNNGEFMSVNKINLFKNKVTY